MKRSALFALATLCSAAAIAAPIKLDNRTPELALNIETQNMNNRVLIATLNNQETSPLMCDMKLYNGPQKIKTRTVTLESQETLSMSYYRQRLNNTQASMSVNCQTV